MVRSEEIVRQELSAERLETRRLALPHAVELGGVRARVEDRGGHLDGEVRVEPPGQVAAVTVQDFANPIGREEGLHRGALDSKRVDDKAAALARQLHHAHLIVVALDVEPHDWPL